MPELKQPISLEKMSLDVLLKCVVTCCDQLSVEGSLEDLRQGVTVIKEKVFNRIPWHLLADFASEFLNYFYREERSVCQLKAGLEMTMDIEIFGLRCKGPILASMNFLQDGYRFRRIKELNLSELTCYPNKINDLTLENLNINYLTTLIFPSYCSDVHLKTVGRNCPNLRVLKVSYSRDVTDEGICALSLCSELRVVDVVECFRVTHIGLSYLLSSNKKLEDFSYGYDVNFERPIGQTEPDMLSGLDWSLRVPSMNRFVFENNRNVRPSVSLRNIIEKFPNLVYLQINCMNSEDLSALKSFDKLTGLEVNFVNGKCLGFHEISITWQSIVEVLTYIGANIKTLSLSVSYQSFTWHQPDLDFIFETCPNLEYLRFDQGNGVLVMPPFKKLKHLVPCVASVFQSSSTIGKPVIQFNELVSLETLSLREFQVNFHLIRTIMLDSKKFPKLSLIKTSYVPVEDLVVLEQLARCNNLDIRIENDRESHWYTDNTFFYDSRIDRRFS